MSKSEESKESVSTALFLAGALAVIASVAALSMPEQAANLTGLDKEELLYISIGLLVVGITDIVIAKTIFKPNNRR